MYCSTIYRQTYSDDVEEDNYSYEDYFTLIPIQIYEQEVNEDFETISEKEIGIMEVCLFDVESAINNHESVVNIADSQNQELSDAILKLFSRRDNGLKDKYRSLNFTENVVYIERLFIKPSFRNLGYAKEIMKNLESILSRLIITDFACMVMLPAAFEYSDSETYKDLLNDSEIPDGKKLTEKLYKFYKRYGFKTVYGSRALYKVWD
jgi:GNAT superfamily N-acetyltransferase